MKRAETELWVETRHILIWKVSLELWFHPVNTILRETTWMFCNISKFPHRFPCTVSSFASVMCHLLILPDSPQACLAPDHRDCYSVSITAQQSLLARVLATLSIFHQSHWAVSPRVSGDNGEVRALCRWSIRQRVRTPDSKQSRIRTRKLLPHLVTIRSQLHKIVLAKRIEVRRSNFNTTDRILGPKFVAISEMQNGESH